MLYKLILVGKPFHDETVGVYRILCHFQPWSVDQNIAVSEEILCYAINSTFAGKLVCGTMWTRTNEPDITNHTLPAHYKSFSINSGKLYSQRLKDVMPLEALSPSKFWATHDDTWVICINSGDTKIILPYFELLRVFFYKISRRLTNFIFSQSSINSLCIPVTFPDKSNSLIARLCVAATECTSQEARLLGCLLFDPQLLYAFNVSQAYWRSAVSRNYSGLIDKATTLNAGDFGNSSYNASGYEFLHSNEKYFWVYSLEVVQYSYKFDKILYYPLKDDKLGGRGNQIKELAPKQSDLPECPDAFRRVLQSSAGIAMRCCSPTSTKATDSNGASYMSTNRQWARAIRKTGLLPLVVRRQPWAKLVPLSSKNRLSSEDILAKSIQAPKPLTVSQPLYNQSFRKLILEFKSHHYVTNPLMLNNQHQKFGKSLSVLPVNNYSPLPTTVYQGFIQRFPCVEVELTNAFIYVSQPFPEVNPGLIVIFIKQSLIRPTTEEWNAFLGHITPVHSAGDLKIFYKNIHHKQVGQTSSNTALLALPIPSNTITAEFCINLTDHIVDKFRRRLQFVLATSLKYPEGLTPEQQTRVTVLSSYICRAPDPLWQARIAYLWH